MPKLPPRPEELTRIAEQYGTPTYVYDASVLDDRIQTMRRYLDGLPTQLLYAMKANPNPFILGRMREAGLGLDVVSPAEALLAVHLGFDPEDLLYTANNLTDEEMHQMHRLGVRLNIGELSRLDRYGAAYPGSRVSVRLNPQVGAGHHKHVVTAGKTTKFGVPVEDLGAVLAVAAQHDLKITGLHQHIGSGYKSAVEITAAVRVLLGAAEQCPDLEYINFGGGFGIPYQEGEAPFDFSTFGEQVVEPLKQYVAASERPLTFMFEPGRFLVAEAGTLLMTVNTVKDTGDRVFAGTDSGFNHLVRPTMYAAHHEVYNLSNPDASLMRYDVVGNICETGDVFAGDRLVPEVREGDVLAVLDAGAYGMAMASTYNLRPLPAEVFLHADGTSALIRRRLTPEDLVRQYLNETVSAVPLHES